MKVLITFISLIFLSTCTPSPYLSLKNDKKKQIIALQPFDNYDESVIYHLTFGIRDFYNKQTIVLPPITMPAHFFDTTIRQYYADSLITLLSGLRNDTIVEVVGITHNPIFTIKGKNDSLPYYDKNIFGFGYQPGSACIVSDSRFSSDYQTLHLNRLRKVIIHEIGHNLGLMHCQDEKCLMSEKNGNTIILDNSGNDYCQKCKDVLYH
jgi:archaemetzincin